MMYMRHEEHVLSQKISLRLYNEFSIGDVKMSSNHLKEMKYGS